MTVKAEIQTNDSEVGLFWSPQATPRPKPTLVHVPNYGGNAVDCNR